MSLGTRGCRAEALLEFLNTTSASSSTGRHIIDFWRLKRSPTGHRRTATYRRVLSWPQGHLWSLSPGNHDEYVRRFCDLQLGNILVVREAVHCTADGRLLLVLHGDEFDAVTRCTDGSRCWATLATSSSWCSSVVQPRAARARFGYWSLAGYIKWNVSARMYVGDFESSVAGGEPAAWTVSFVATSTRPTAADRRHPVLQQRLGGDLHGLGERAAEAGVADLRREGTSSARPARSAGARLVTNLR